jgi:hypothetical protein
LVPANIHDSAVSLRVGQPRGRSSSTGKIKNFIFSRLFRPALESSEPPIQLVLVVFSQEITRTSREAGHSPTRTVVQKMWIYTSTFTYASMAEWLIKVSTGTTLPFYPCLANDPLESSNYITILHVCSSYTIKHKDHTV